MWFQRTRWPIGFMATAVLMWGCGSGAERAIEEVADAIGAVSEDSTAELTSDVDSTRKLNGTVPRTPSVEGDISASGECLANAVVAIDAMDGGRVEADVDANCQFSIDLQVDHAYQLFLMKDGEEVATLHMPSNSAEFTNQFLVVAVGVVDIDLGDITIVNNIAFPEHNPNDHGDGKDDWSDRDCDLDGKPDDFDDDKQCNDDDDDACATVLKVKPRNGQENVHLKQKVKAVVSCDIDESTLTSETFKVVAENGEAIDCVFEIKNHGGKQVIICQHDASLFLAETRYTATLDGVKCEDRCKDDDWGEGKSWPRPQCGCEIEPKSWSWTTAKDRDDKECPEDTVDELIGTATATGDSQGDANSNGNGNATAGGVGQGDANANAEDGTATAGGEGSGQATATTDHASGTADGSGAGSASAGNGNASASANGSANATADSQDDGNATGSAAGNGSASASSDGETATTAADGSGSGTATAEDKSGSANGTGSGTGSGDAAVTTPPDDDDADEAAAE